MKLAKQKQKAEAKRKATPVVGDMQPLMEALPELSDLTTGIKGRKPSKRYVSLSNGLCYFPFSCKLKHPPAQIVATNNTSLGPIVRRTGPHLHFAFFFVTLAARSLNMPSESTFMRTVLLKGDLA